MCYYIKIFFIVFYLSKKSYIIFKKFYIVSKKNYIFKYCIIDFVLFFFLTSENNTNHKSTFEKKIENTEFLKKNK